uniref:Ig-like domain-containing protein n=1 Tax=Cyprinus carpio TaxID=7962 RepID=A0A8C2ETL2_CYPCA
MEQNLFGGAPHGDVYRLTIYDLTLEDSGQYMCRAKNNVGEAYAAVTLKVGLPETVLDRAPVFTVKPVSTRVGPGGDVTFYCRVAAHPAPNFDWEKDGRYLGETNRIKIISENESSSLRIQSVRSLDSGTYTCRAQNSIGRAQAAAALVVDLQDTHLLNADKSSSLLSHMQKRKEDMRKDISLYRTMETSSTTHTASSSMITEELGSLGLAYDQKQRVSALTSMLPKGVFTRTCMLTEGKHAKLSCFVTGHPKPQIIWRKDGANISEGRRHVMYEDQAENFILKVLYCKQSDNGLYTCNASNLFQSSGRHHDVTALGFGFLLSIVVFLEKPLDLTAKEGQTVTLSCMTSDPEASVAWYKDEAMIKAGGRYLLYKDRAVHQLRILRVEEGDAGLYTCKTKDAERILCLVSAEAEVLIVSGIKNTDVFVGEQATFSCQLSRRAKGRVQWWLDSTRLENSTFSEISVGEDHVHTLTLRNLSPNDSGTVLFKTGALMSSAKLLVKGTKCRGAWQYLAAQRSKILKL